VISSIMAEPTTAPEHPGLFRLGGVGIGEEGKVEPRLQRAVLAQLLQPVELLVVELAVLLGGRALDLALEVEVGVGLERAGHGHGLADQRLVLLQLVEQLEAEVAADQVHDLARGRAQVVVLNAQLLHHRLGDDVVVVDALQVGDVDALGVQIDRHAQRVGLEGRVALATMRPTSTTRKIMATVMAIRPWALNQTSSR
jgi:hypothetical protein